MWNPEVSSVKVKDWKRIMNNYPFEKLNWSVWEHYKVKWPSQCYMVRVGEGNTGVVMKGNFIGDPQKSEDWSGKGRETYYCNINPWTMLDPEKQPIITTKELQEKIPTFDWTGGHSGRLLTVEEAEKLDALWNDYSKEHKAFIEKQKEQFEYCIDKRVANKIEGFDNLVDYFRTYWKVSYKENPNCVYMESYYGDTVNLEFSHDYCSSTFRLRYMLQNAVLPITCTSVHRIEMNLNDESTSMDWFRITSIWKDCFLLEANGIRLVCDKITFGKAEAYDEDSYPVCI